MKCPICNSEMQDVNQTSDQTPGPWLFSRNTTTRHLNCSTCGNFEYEFERAGRDELLGTLWHDASRRLWTPSDDWIEDGPIAWHEEK